MAIEMKVDMLQLFSQWANFTGEKGPKNYWGSFLTYTYSFGKSLPSRNFPSKSFSKIIRSKKKILTFIESNTHVTYLQENSNMYFVITFICFISGNQNFEQS